MKAVLVTSHDASNFRNCTVQEFDSKLE